MSADEVRAACRATAAADPGADVPMRAFLDRAIARSTLLNAAARAVSILGWLVLAPVILHGLGAERFGLWSLVGTLLGLYLTLDLGLVGSITKFVAEFRARHDAEALSGALTLGVAIYAGLAIAGVALVAGGCPMLLDFFHVAAALRTEAAIALVGAAAAYGLANLWALQGAVLAGLQRLDVQNRITIVVTLLQLAGVVAALRLGLGVPGLVAASGIATLAGLGLSARAIRGLAPEIHLAPRAVTAALWRRLTGYSAALQVVNLGVLVQFQLEKFLFPRFLGLVAVANFELGFRVAFGAWAVPTVLLAPLLAAHAHLEATGDRVGIEQLYLRSSRTLLAIAMPLAAALVALAPVLCIAWLGPGHDDAGRAAGAIAALLWVNVLTSAGCMVARGTGRAWIEARYQLLSIAIHLPLALAWIPRYGFRGGLAALMVSGTVGTIYFLWAFHRDLGVAWAGYARRIVAPPALASAGAAALAWWTSVAITGGEAASRGRALAGLLTGTGTFMAVALAVLFATRYVTIAELRLGYAGLARALRGAGGDALP